VQQRRRIALDLYLLGRAAMSEASPALALPSGAWARAIGISSRAGTAATISNSWSWLEREGLLVTAPHGRLREVRFTDFPEAADGGKDERWFELPRAYWRARYPDRLDLSAKAVLLIALSLDGSFGLSGAPAWGLSNDTLRRGSTTLIRLGLLDFAPHRQTAPLSSRGYTIERRYSLRPPFGSAAAPQPSGVAAGRRRQRAATGPTAIYG
jgi:hypothetical protein